MVTRYFQSIVLGCLLLSACYPGGADEFGETDLVITAQEPDADFDDIVTFALPDEVTDLGELDEDDPDSTIHHNFDTLILDTIRDNMEALGYTYSEDDEGADIFIPVGAVISTTWILYTYYDYWGYWGFYPGYGGGTWIGYPVTGISAYQSGSIVFSFIRPEDIQPIGQQQSVDDSAPRDAADGEQRVTALWVASINGLVGSGPTETQQRITDTIHQAFSQSPYLGRN